VVAFAGFTDLPPATNLLRRGEETRSIRETEPGKERRLHMPAQANLSLDSTKVAGREYPLVMERTCKTCSSQYRNDIEEQTVAGRTWRAIIGDLPDDAGLTERNLADHFKNQHLPVAAEAVQQLAERNATAAGERTQRAVTACVDYLEFAKAIIGDVNDRVARGETRAEVRDALRAAELLARYEPIEEVDGAAVTEAFIVYHETAQALMTREQFTEFGRRLNADPVLTELLQRYKERADQPKHAAGGPRVSR
jgi:hypothetical protein